jgi:propanol-preferring alcohol dehydrogenase
LSSLLISVAVRCSKPNGPWEVVTLPIRKPKENEVLVRVHASGICNSDHFIKDGLWPGVEYPRIPGHEVIGRIADVGSNLVSSDRFKVGALVGVGWNGGYCNHCDYCRQGEFWTCRTVGYTGFTVDGGHGEYMYATETGEFDIARTIHCSHG